jgi:hypothetical protein
MGLFGLHGASRFAGWALGAFSGAFGRRFSSLIGLARAKRAKVAFLKFTGARFFHGARA